MENTHENQNQVVSQGDNYADAMKMFDSYYNENESNNKSKPSREDMLSKYFTPRNSIEQFRILPPLSGREIIEKAFFHYVPVNKATATGKGWRKIYCPAHNSPRVPKLDSQGNKIVDQSGNHILVAEKCPLCEKATEIEKALDTSVKYIKKEDMTPEQLLIREKNSEIYKKAGTWKARRYSIVRGVDRGTIKDGVKYWRFKDDFRNQGVLDKLVPALKLFTEEHKTSPVDTQKGSDLYINVVDSKMANGNLYKYVSSITARNPSILYTDQIVMDQWLGDKSTWREVYKEANMTKVLTSAEYLDRVANGRDPYWDDRDQDNKRYVFPDPADADLMAKSNERSESLDADTKESYEMASDVSASSIVSDSYSVNIENVTKDDTGVAIDDAVNVGAQFVPTETVQEPVAEQAAPVTTPVEADSDDEGYDDLPF